MSKIRTIIRTTIKGDWIEVINDMHTYEFVLFFQCFKNSSPLTDDTIQTLRHECTSHLLEQWS